MECRSLELIPPKKDGILSLQNFSSRVAKRERGKIVQNHFFFKKGLKIWDHRKDSLLTILYHVEKSSSNIFNSVYY